MSVWLTIPSARPPAEAEPILEKWRKQGYKIAILRDQHDWSELPYDRILVDPHGYPGYAKSVNALIKDVCYMDSSAEWFVIGGDDVEPDANYTAEEIAAQCTNHFEALWIERCNKAQAVVEHLGFTFGIMQPTGDRFAGGSIDRIAGSAWLGRKFCERINQGRGPLWPEYEHMFVDEELQNVAIKYGVFWQRPDLIHLHHHFMRQGPVAVSTPPPPHLVKWNTREHWNESKAIFSARKAAGFPGSEPTNER